MRSLESLVRRPLQWSRPVRRRSEGRFRRSAMRRWISLARDARRAAARRISFRVGSSRRMSTTSAGDRISQLLDEFRHSRDLMVAELSKVVIGQRDVIEQILAAIFTRGHVLLVGVPGLAKTLMVSSIARILDVGFKRIQFTPDLMPSDITGTNVLEEPEAGRRAFRFVPGPIFSNIILADEINRTPPKTQAALLQAMQEREVTVGQETLHLPDPFFVIATQNPIEQEGTYPLPEAQLDRFMFDIRVGYPTHRGRGEDPLRHDPRRVDRPEEDALGQGDHQPPEAGHLGPGRRITRSSTWPVWCARRARPTRSRRSSSRTWSTSAPAPGPGRTCSSAPRRWRPWTAGSASRSTTSARSPSRSFATGSRPISRRRPKDRRPIASSRSC